MTRQGKRLCAALLCCAILLGIIILGDGLDHRSFSWGREEADETKSIARDERRPISTSSIGLSSDDVTYQIFQAVGGNPSGTCEVDRSFIDDLFDPSILVPEDVAASNDVVGIITPVGEMDAMDTISAVLAEKGWRSIDSVTDESALGQAFVKEEGDITWSYVLCRPVIDSTVVIVFLGVGVNDG